MNEGLNSNFLTNSNDISYGMNIVSKIIKNNIINNSSTSNKIYTIPEEMKTYSLESHNLSTKSKNFYNIGFLDKMKGNDINYKYENENMSNINSKDENNNNFNFSTYNNFSNYDNDININNK